MGCLTDMKKVVILNVEALNRQAFFVLVCRMRHSDFGHLLFYCGYSEEGVELARF